jgi:alkylated DNA repair dioxygenase AlkB
MFTNHKRLMGNSEWWLDYWKMDLVEADKVFEASQQLDFQKRPRIEGTSSRLKRNVVVLSDTAPGYQISKQSNAIIAAKPLTPVFSRLLESINSQFDENFNLLLFNEYDQYDTIGPHADSFYGYGKQQVTTISLGATRIYRLRSRETGAIAMDYEMKHGDVLIMSNKFQILYEHEIPESEVRCGTRISITTRHIDETRQINKKRTRGHFVPRPPKQCLRCTLATDSRSGVCVKCYELATFECPNCKQPTGAPWLCNSCFVNRQVSFTSEGSAGRVESSTAAAAVGPKADSHSE